MAKSQLQSRESRRKLKASQRYVEPLEKAADFVYRKGRQGAGSWALRRYLGRERGYTYEPVGAADDLTDPDGTTTLSYFQGRERARERLAEIEDDARLASHGPIVSVRQAIEDYLGVREKRETKALQNGKGAKRDARSRLTKHIIQASPELANKALANLTKNDLSKWRASLQLADGSVRRTSNDLKAALNAAVKHYEEQMPPRVRDIIRDGLATTTVSSPDAREAQVLADADVRAIIAAAWEVDAEGCWEGDLARLVLVLAASGARFSQVIRMTVADVQADQKRLMIPVSRKGRGTKKTTHVAVRVGNDVLAALAKVTAGRRGTETLLLRPRWRQVGLAKWEKGDRDPWFAAAELTRPWAAIIARAGLAPGTIPYALRHSAIVRGLRVGLPVRLVAALCDTSSAMIEKHYSSYIVDAMNDLAARAIVPLTTEPAAVVKFRA